MERTFAIIKPNAFADGNSGKIISRIYEEGFKIVGLKKLYLSQVEAEGFYYVHKERPFFGELTEFMSSGPCVVMVLEADNAILKWRDLMGATNPADAAEGTLRRQFGASLGENATHGSDAPGELEGDLQVHWLPISEDPVALRLVIPTRHEEAYR